MNRSNDEDDNDEDGESSVYYPVDRTSEDNRREIENLQAEWKESEAIELASVKATNLIDSIVADYSSSLTSIQSESLALKLSSWLNKLRSGSYEDYLTFRDLDYNLVGDWAPSHEDLKKHHDSETTLLFSSIREDTARLIVVKWNSEHDSMWQSNVAPDNTAKPYYYYPGTTRTAKGNSYNVMTGEPVRGYNTKPIDVLNKHDGIYWARFRAAFDTVGFNGFIAPVELALYWSPDSKKWLAGELIYCRIPNWYIPEKYMLENSYLPDMYF